MLNRWHLPGGSILQMFRLLKSSLSCHTFAPSALGGTAQESPSSGKQSGLLCQRAYKELQIPAANFPARLLCFPLLQVPGRDVLPNIGKLDPIYQWQLGFFGSGEMGPAECVAVCVVEGVRRGWRKRFAGRGKSDWKR